MSTYTFTSSVCYPLSTHEVSFTKDKITIKLTATGTVVYSKTYGSAGIAFICQGNNFCIGTLTANAVFVKKIDYGNKKAKMWVDEKNNANQFIGSDDESDPSVFHKYNLNRCPVRLKENAGNSDMVDVECPCDSSSGPCNNSCYTYG